MVNVYERVLLTGGAGFIGSHLLEQLLRQSQLQEIVVIDSLVTGQRKNLEPYLTDSRVTFWSMILTIFPGSRTFSFRVTTIRLASSFTSRHRPVRRGTRHILL